MDTVLLSALDNHPLTSKSSSKDYRARPVLLCKGFLTVAKTSQGIWISVVSPLLMSGSCVSKETGINGTTRNALLGAKWH